MDIYEHFITAVSLYKEFPLNFGYEFQIWTRFTLAEVCPVQMLVLLLYLNVALFVVHSLGVEPVDHDVLKQPPRKAKDPIISRQLIINVIISAAIIVSGTLWVFWREVR